MGRGVAEQVHREAGQRAVGPGQEAEHALDALGGHPFAAEGAQAEARHVRVDHSRVGIRRLGDEDADCQRLPTGSAAQREQRGCREIRVGEQVLLQLGHRAGPQGLRHQGQEGRQVLPTQRRDASADLHGRRRHLDQVHDEVDHLPGQAEADRVGVQPAGWREAAGAYGDPDARRSIADVVDQHTLQEVRAFKKEQKAAAKK